MYQGIEGGLFVVRRPFKAHGTLYVVGQVIEDPTTIKLFRSRLNDRDIIELLPGQEAVNASWLEYLLARAEEQIDPRVYPLAGREIPKVMLPEAEVVPEAPAVVTPEPTPTAPVAPAATAPATKVVTSKGAKVVQSAQSK